MFLKFSAIFKTNSLRFLEKTRSWLNISSYFSPSESQAAEKKKAEIKDELKGISEVPSTTRRGVSLLPGSGESSEAFKKRKTMAAVVDDEELDDSFEEKARNWNEMKNMREKPSGKNRGCSLTPGKQSKKIDQRKTIAAKEVDEKFVADLKIQSELVRMDDQPAAASAKRAATMMPENFTKAADQRKSLAPGEAREDFIQFALIQNEMKNIHDEPSVAASKRAQSESPEKKTKADNRMTVIPQAGEASKDFLKFIDEQNQKKIAEKSSDVEEIEQAELDEATGNEEVVRAVLGVSERNSDQLSVESILDSDEEAEKDEKEEDLEAENSEEIVDESAEEVPETAAEETSEKSVGIPNNSDEIPEEIVETSDSEEISEGIEEIPDKIEEIPDKISKEIDDIPEEIEEDVETPVEIEEISEEIEETPEKYVKIPDKIEENMEIIEEISEEISKKTEEIPENLPENISEEVLEVNNSDDPEKVAEEIPKVTTEDSESPEDSPELVPVIEPTCIVKSIYLTTQDSAKVEAIEIPTETPRRRKRAIDYAVLDSGSKRTPRRGRSASIDTAPKSVVKRKLTPIKQESKKLAKQLIEEDVEVVVEIQGTLKIEGELMKKKVMGGNNKFWPKVSAEPDEKPENSDHNKKTEEEAEKTDEDLEEKPAEIEEKVGKNPKKVEKVEKKKSETIEKEEENKEFEQETEPAEEKSSRRRGQRVNYNALSTGTPTKASTSSEKLPEKRAQKKLLVEADEEHEPTIGERRGRRGKTPSMAVDEVKETKSQRVRKMTQKELELHLVKFDVQSTKPEAVPKEPEVLPSIDVDSQESEDEIAQPAKVPAKRGRKKKDVVEAQPEVPEVVKQATKRGRRAEFPEVVAVVEKEPETSAAVTKALPRRGKLEAAASTGTEDVELSEVHSKRGRKAAKKVPEIPEPVEISKTAKIPEVPAPTPIKKPAKRGRKEIQTTETESQDSTDDAAVVAKPSRRGKKPAEVETEPIVEVSLPKRGKKEELESIPVAVTKSRRGAAKRKVETSEEEVETTPAILKNQRIAQLSEEVAATPTKRGRRGATPEVPEVKLEQQAKRGRKKVEVEVEVVEAVEEAPKKGRGRVKKEVTEEPAGEFLVV